MSSPISGFTAVPNPYMVPLLYYQSLLIGAGFGIGYQGMRRKLSAMPNKEFNEIDLGTFAFDQFKEITAKSHFDKALNMMHPIMDKLAAAFGQMINKLPDNFMSFFRGVKEGPPQTETSFIDYSNTGEVSAAAYYGSLGIPLGAQKGLTPDKQLEGMIKLAEDLKQQIENIIKFKQTPKPIVTQAERVSKDIQRSREAAKGLAPIQTLDTSIRQVGKTQFKTAAQHKATSAANKRKLQANLKSAEAYAKLKNLEVQRMKVRLNQVRKNVSAGRMQARTLLLTTISLRKITAIRADANKKVQNLKTLLRNYR